MSFELSFEDATAPVVLSKEAGVRFPVCHVLVSTPEKRAITGWSLTMPELDKRPPRRSARSLPEAHAAALRESSTIQLQPREAIPFQHQYLGALRCSHRRATRDLTSSGISSLIISVVPRGGASGVDTGMLATSTGATLVLTGPSLSTRAQHSFPAGGAFNNYHALPRFRPAIDCHASTAPENTIDPTLQLGLSCIVCARVRVQLKVSRDRTPPQHE